MAVKALFQAFYLENVVSADYPGRQMDMDLCIGLCGLFDDLDLVQHFLPALRPADGFFTIKGFQLGDDLLLVFNFSLLV